MLAGCKGFRAALPGRCAHRLLEPSCNVKWESPQQQGVPQSHQGHCGKRGPLARAAVTLSPEMYRSCVRRKPCLCEYCWYWRVGACMGQIVIRSARAK